MKSKNLVLALVLALAVALAAPASAAPPVGSTDREFALMNEEIPGFGGLYYDADGVPVVFLTNPDDPAARERIGAEARVVRGDFEFAQLSEWRQALRPALLALPGVVTLDVDETTNRIVVGVDRNLPQRAASRVATHAAAAGVPSRAVVVERVDPIHQLVTLRDQLRPVPGGVQIHFGNFLCTLGFNATRSGVSGFVTNSHCTDQQGGVEGTEYFQPLSPAAIGTEIADPSYRRNIAGCPRGRVCRYSDSSFAAYDSSLLSDFAHIARTVSVNTGSLEINATSPLFTITSTGSSAVGQTVNKVGRTTGWTSGVVDSTCVDVGVSGTNIVQLCQDIALAGVGSGDSGSPVFADSGSGNVQLRGILWGGNNAGTLFVYSPFANIVRSDELGPLTVH